jgi:hypothetical protein
VQYRLILGPFLSPLLDGKHIPMKLIGIQRVVSLTCTEPRGFYNVRGVKSNGPSVFKKHSILSASLFLLCHAKLSAFLCVLCVSAMMMGAHIVQPQRRRERKGSAEESNRRNLWLMVFFDRQTQRDHTQRNETGLKWRDDDAR